MATIDLGRLKPVFKGTWSGATAYAADDMVQYTDTGVINSYICILAHTNQVPSTSQVENSTYWRFLARGTSAITISWNAVQTADFTAVAKNGYHVNTTSGAINITLPASPADGDEIKIVDYAKTFHTNNVTLLANGKSIEGSLADFVLYGKGTQVELVFNSANNNWKFTTFTNDDILSQFNKVRQTPSLGSKKYMIVNSDAEEVYLDGDYMVHKFLTSGFFNVKSLGSDATFGNKIRYLLVGGGGSGGTHHAGGGGAGGLLANAGFLETVTVQNYTITVGAGGAQRQSNAHGNDGSASNAFGLTAAGGGGGGGQSNQGRNGGSGGGAGHNSTHGNANGQGVGHRGGDHGGHNAGGGGGAGQRGANNYGGHSVGHGGIGSQNDITGINVWYAGGGGAAGHDQGVTAEGGLGGGGGGGGGAGIDGYGGGGGGCEGANGHHQYGGKGGDGIIIIKYKAKD